MDSANHALDVDTFELDRTNVLHRLEQRFPHIDPSAVQRVVDETAKATEGAKVRSFRALLVERSARDRLAHLAS